MSQTNPLEKFFRQPKFNLRLPSGGRWYPKGALQLNDDGTVPVFAMTAKDDMLFKNGELLLERQSTLDLLQSCIPAVKQPEFMPSLDLDACLLAIRKATYGDELKMTVIVPVLKTARTIILAISDILASQGTADKFDPDLTIEADDGSTMQIKIKPIPLNALLNSTKSVIAQNDIFKTADSEKFTDEQKIEKINNAFRLIDKISTDMVLESIETLTAESQIITSSTAIRSFLQNCDAAFFNAIKEHIENQKDAVGLKPVIVKCTDDEKALGAPDQFDVEVKFDNVEFFK